MDRPITVTVQVQLTGESKGVKQQDGVLEFLNREVEIEVLPSRFPSAHRGRLGAGDRPGRARARPGEGRALDAPDATAT